jgi:hypothetical protein
MSDKTPNGHSVPEIFKEMSQWEPEYVKTVVDEIWQEIYSSADVEKEKFQLAVNRVCADGFSGPISDDEWEEATGSKISLKEALKIVKDGMDAGFNDVKYYNPDYYDPQDPHYEEDDNEDRNVGLPDNNCVIKGDDIKRTIFKWYFDIYGGR